MELPEERINNLTTNSSSSTTIPSSTEPNDISPNKRPPLRRSRSVSAFPRIESGAFSEFEIKRDNLNSLGINSGLDSETHTADAIDITKFGDVTFKSPEGNINDYSSVDDNTWGRSISKIADYEKIVMGNRTRSGRRLSKVGRGRRFRSVSRPPLSRRSSMNSESEMEQESQRGQRLQESDLNRNKLDMIRRTATSTMMSKNNSGISSPITNEFSRMNKNSTALRSSSDVFDQMKVGQTFCRQNPTWEDRRSASFLSGVEGNIKRATSEPMPILADTFRGDASTGSIYESVQYAIRRAISDIQTDLENAIQRNSASIPAAKNVADISPGLVSPGAVEIMIDIRSEYTEKLKQSHERARKLRAELAVEEHRVLELGRILKDVLPDPKTPSMQKSRPSRKSSIERRKMSKRLNEEAKSKLYFVESVSQSAFDSSDLSSQEDRPYNISGVATPVDNIRSILRTSSSSSTAYHPTICSSANQVNYSRDARESFASSSSKRPTEDPLSVNRNISGWDRRKQRFSFSRKPTEAVELEQDIRKYAKKFEKDNGGGDIDSLHVSSNNIDVEAYNSKDSPQSILLDRVYFKNRLETGSLLLCGGGYRTSFFPFAF